MMLVGSLLLPDGSVSGISNPSVSSGAFPVKTDSPEMLHLFVKTRFLTQTRGILLLPLL